MHFEFLDPRLIPAQRWAGWIPVLLLASLALLTWWLHWKIQMPDRVNGGVSSAPSYIVRDFVATRYGIDGRPVQNLQAEAMQHYELDKRSHLVAPRFVLSPPGEPVLTVVADQADSEKNQERLVFSGHVQVVRNTIPSPGQNGNQGNNLSGVTELTTSYLEVFPQEGLARTSQSFRLVTPRGYLHGVGLEVDHKTHMLRLKSKVHMEIPPIPKR